VIEDMIWTTATRTTPISRALLALLVLGGAVLLALSSGPAEAATTFTVNTTDDAADIQITNGACDSDPAAGRQCTLRAAIEEANDTAGADTIDFDISTGGAVKIISPASALPSITDTVTIDGYTQSGASPNTLATGNDADLRVQLDGSGAGSGVVGLVIEATDTTIKGLVIRRFDDYGIQLLTLGDAGNKVEGNFIGVNRDGITDLGNSDGVFLQGDSNTIGGTQPAMRNVISGNDGIGVFIGSVASSNRIEGNYIGTTADGTADLGNDYDGVYIADDSNTVGGTAAGARNVISGNDGSGIVLSGSVSEENRIEGNYIGTGADGTGNLGNTLDGVTIQNEAELNAVGGTASRAGNRIAHNGEDGVSIATASVGNHVLSNSIFDNDGLGIDLLGGTEDANGVTANDTDDPDAGPNDLQNFPVIRSATKSSATARTTTILGRLNSDPSQDFVVQCFLTSGAPASAHGEGLRLLDTALASTNVNGNTSFSCDSSLPLLGQRPGQTVSATATNIVTGDTSEFSKNKAITIGP
jgi:hypothetical protein